MRKKISVFFFIVFGLAFSISAQQEVLFTLGDTKVHKDEFEYIYNKNNFNNKADYSRKSLEDYLNLYINFRLKVKEAIDQGLDQNDRFKEELASYEKQLLESYVEKDVQDKLVRKEYERSGTDVNISHIFFAVGPNVDYVQAFSKADQLSKRIKSGMSFEEAAKLSEDKQTYLNAGKIGWVNSFQLSLPEIEEIVYSMKPGDISEPIKTKIGYHIINLNEIRAARPRLKAAIVKRYFSVGDTSERGKKLAEDTIRLVYSKLKSGLSFDKAVQLYSEDEATKGNSGLLDWFGINTYAKVFEDAVYALKDGEYAPPFRTSSAWYIVKRIETAKPLSFEEAAPVIKTKLQNLPQYQYELDKFIAKLSNQLSVKYFKENYTAFKDRLNMLTMNSAFAYRDTVFPITLMQIGDRQYNENDFGKRIQETYYSFFTKPGEDKYTAMIDNVAQNFVLNAYKEYIKSNNKEYKSLMEEYRNGIMIFTLSEKYIWNKASEDSIGLLSYYNLHKADFNINKKATQRKVYVNDLQQAVLMYKFLLENNQVADGLIKQKMKSIGVVKQRIESQELEEKTDVKPLKEFVEKPLNLDGKYVINQVYNIIPEQPRALSECRGYVVAAYQQQLEKDWLNDLKRKYPVDIHRDVFESMVKR